MHTVSTGNRGFAKASPVVGMCAYRNQGYSQLTAHLEPVFKTSFAKLRSILLHDADLAVNESVSLTTSMQLQ